LVRSFATIKILDSWKRDSPKSRTHPSVSPNTKNIFLSAPYPAFIRYYSSCACSHVRLNYQHPVCVYMCAVVAILRECAPNSEFQIGMSSSLESERWKVSNMPPVQGVRG